MAAFTQDQRRKAKEIGECLVSVVIDYRTCGSSKLGKEEFSWIDTEGVAKKLENHAIDLLVASNRRNTGKGGPSTQVFSNCNVCGIRLRTDDEENMGMCDRCAAE